MTQIQENMAYLKIADVMIDTFFQSLHMNKIQSTTLQFLTFK